MQQTQDESWPHNDADMEREHASVLTEAQTGADYADANRPQAYVPEVEYSSGPSAEEMVYVPEAAVPAGTFNPAQKGAMDDELARLRELTAGSKTHEGDTAEHTHTQSNGAGEAEGEAAEGAGEAEGEEDDEVVRRSIYVGNVDYGATPQELQEHFARCGKIHRVTIMVDKFTGHPKGFAYLEFSDQAAANNALMLANTTLRGRQIKVLAKRKNIAGLSRGRGGPGGRGRGRGGAFFGGMYGMPYGPMGRGGGAAGGGGAYGPKYRGRGGGGRGASGPY